MRIALITIPGLYGAYFAREVQAQRPGDEFLVFCQVQEPPAATRGAGAPPPPAANRPTGPQLARKIFWKLHEVATMRINPLRAASIWQRPNVIRTSDINSEENVARLQEFQPDVILIFGGRIVRPPVLATARRVALNVHGGKLPEYRGANGIKWMLWRGDLDRVCATVHIAAPEVDAGAIVREARVALRRGDSYRTIFARLHVAGVRAMLDAVREIEAGSLRSSPQTGPARTYRAREWTPQQEALMDRRLRTALAKRDIRPLERRITFQAYRRLHRVRPSAFEPHPAGSVALLYHHVASEENAYVSRLGITITPEHFEQHVEYLTRKFDVIPFSALRERQGDPRAVALTFDDGFASVATTVLPIIERHRCPIKLYVVESLVDQPFIWLNKLSFVMNALTPAELEALMVEALDRPASFTPREPIFQFIEYFAPDRTEVVLDRYFARVHRGAPPRLYLDETQIRRLLDHPLVEVGSHTRVHHPQHRLTDAGRHDEIVQAHRDLVARFDDRIRGFALPFGYREHFTPGVVADIREVDQSVVSAYGGYADAATVHGEPEIRRIGVWGNLGTLWHQMARGA